MVLVYLEFRKNFGTVSSLLGRLFSLAPALLEML